MVEIANALTNAVIMVTVGVMVTWFLKGRIDEVNRRFDDVDRRFERIDGRFEQIDRRFEQMDRRFDNLERSLADVRSDLTKVALAVGAGPATGAAGGR